MQEEKRTTDIIPYEEGHATEQKQERVLKDGEAPDEPDAKESDEGGPIPQEKRLKKQPNSSGIIIGILSIIIAGLLLFIGWHHSGKENPKPLVPPSVDASVVMDDKYSPSLKAKHLNPSKVYQLASTEDTLHGMTVAVTKIQFRQDATRLWVRVANNSGKTISMIPSANSKLVDNNGRTYKNDPFGGDRITSVSAGAHEEVLLVYEPIREDADSLTFSLDGVFGAKDVSWGYSVQFDIP